jgi:hypothetical protein
MIFRELKEWRGVGDSFLIFASDDGIILRIVGSSNDMRRHVIMEARSGESTYERMYDYEIQDKYDIPMDSIIIEQFTKKHREG